MISKTNTHFYFWLSLLAGLLFITLPNLGNNFSLLPGDLGDTRFNIYILEHATQFFSGQIDSYWNAGFMYPEPEVIAYSDNLLGTAPIYGFFRILGMGVFSSFQCWFIVLTVLNFWSAFKLTNYLTKNAATASIAAFIFAFSLGLTAQLNHAQTFPRFAIPLAIYFLLRWQKDLKISYFFIAITLTVYQFYCGIYLGFLFSISFGCLLLLLIISKRKELLAQLKILKNSFFYGGSIILNLLLLYVLFAPYIRKPGSGYTYEQIYESIPTVKSYFSAPPGSLFAGQLNSLSNEYSAFWDHWIFPGCLSLAAFILLPAWLIYRFKKDRTNLLLDQPFLLLMLTGYMSFFVCLRVDDLSPFYFVHPFPGFSSLRSITRIINIEILFFALSLAILYPLLKQKIKIHEKLFFMLFLGILTIDNYVKPDKINATPKHIMQQRQDNMIAKMKHLKPGTIVSYEPLQKTDLAFINQLDAMLAAQQLHLKCINAYTATSPPSYSSYWFEPNAENRKKWLSAFPKMKNKIEVIQ